MIPLIRKNNTLLSTFAILLFHVYVVSGQTAVRKCYKGCGILSESSQYCEDMVYHGQYPNELDFKNYEVQIAVPGTHEWKEAAEYSCIDIEGTDTFYSETFHMRGIVRTTACAGWEARNGLTYWDFTYSAVSCCNVDYCNFASSKKAHPLLVTGLFLIAGLWTLKSL